MARVEEESVFLSHAGGNQDCLGFAQFSLSQPAGHPPYSSAVACCARARGIRASALGVSAASASGLNTPLTPLMITVAPTLHKTLLNSIQVFEMTRAGVQKFQLEQLYLAMTWTSCVLDTSPDLVRNLK